MIDRKPSGKRTKRMHKLVKLGLFVFIKRQTPTKPRTAPRGRQKPARLPTLFYEKGQLNVIEAKAKLTRNEERAVTTLSGTPLPLSADGWIEGKPLTDAAFHMTAIKCVRMSDGSTLKFYKCVLKPSVLKAKQKQARNKLRKIQSEDRAAAKRRVRLTLALMGKKCR